MILLDNPFATLSEYELRHLAAHLAAIGRDEDLHRLPGPSSSPERLR